MRQMIPRGWKYLELKDFLRCIAREVEKPKQSYLSLGIRSHCKGTFIREVENPDKVMMETLFEVKKDDLIVNITFAWEGAIALIKKTDEGALVSHRFPTYVFNRDVAIPEYFRYLIPSKRFIYNLGVISPGGAGRNRVLDKKDFLHLKFAIPPILEQKKIAKILSTWDKAIETLEKLIDAKTRFKKSLMQKLLTGKHRLTGHNGKWIVKKLHDIADIDPENLSCAVSQDYRFRYISLEDVDTGVLRSYSDQIFFSAPSRARRKLKKGDILIATVRPNLMSHLLFDKEELNWICSTGFSVVRCKDKVAFPGYVFFHLFSENIAKQFEMMLTGSNYPAINSNDVKALKIPIPADYFEQVAIAEIFLEIDREFNILLAMQELFKKQKKGLTQKLLTGKVRVKI